TPVWCAAGHAADDRRGKTVNAGGVPIKHPAQISECMACHWGTAAVLNLIKQVVDIGARGLVNGAFGGLGIDEPFECLAPLVGGADVCLAIKRHAAVGGTPHPAFTG